MKSNNYNPDVLTCLANLSNDEVFTPPALVNQMLDLLPSELWSNPNAKFLDPVCKSGVFLREMAKRLMKGLENQIPDQQKRINHIFTQQLYGIAITELTALLSRRSVYCTKKANHEKYSICTDFTDEQGNILYERLSHTFQNGKCTYCGASQSVYDRDDDLETYAYNFIHLENPFELFKDKNMQFDVIIGNPPYQLNVGIEQKNFAISLYHKFIMQSIKLKPNYLLMIIPARWYAGGRGLDDFRAQMLNDKRIKILHDFFNASDVFPGVLIKGGVCYFLWDKSYNGNCTVVNHLENNKTSTLERPLLESDTDTFIRFNQAITIWRKVWNIKRKNFSKIVSVQTPFGIITSFKRYKNEYFNGAIKFYTNNAIGFIEFNEISKNIQWVKKWKVYLSAAYGAGDGYPHQILNKPFLGEPNSCCSQTYLVIGEFDSKEQTLSVISYIKTKFFRFMVMLKKNAQHNMRDVFSFVPIQDFSEPWSDEKLYKKYGLTQEEIDFIESMIKPME